MPVHLPAAEVARDLAVRDLTDPDEGPHAVQLLIRRAVDALTSRWGCPARWARGPRVVTVADNYDSLRFDRYAVSRDARYTRYVDEHHVLRSHSSAMIPPALRALATAEEDDVLLVCPGIVFRRDAIDRCHTGTPHQLDLWRIRRGPLGDRDLETMITTLLGALAPGAGWRAQPRSHPYTQHGRQVDVEHDGAWLEVWECGLAHPGVLAAAGLGPGWSGLALGMGLDRLLMHAKGIGDIRLLRSEDPRVAAQMQDLEPYRLVSAMPAVRRDLSVAVDGDDTAEDLGDRVRLALGPESGVVEEVAVLAETPCWALPPEACARLGARLDQRNLLVRVVLRDLHRTLTDDDANCLRDRIFAALHRGTAATWAAATSG